MESDQLSLAEEESQPASEKIYKPMHPDQKQIMEKIANAIRTLSMDAVQKANSGHPGLPLGCAEIGAYLYGHILKHNPRNPKWINRDRFILSAGHGSMWLYSCLHLSGFALSLEEIKNFRQLHSITPGHPESRDTPGVETTTGPLGQGVGNAVGTALGLKLLAAKFNTEKHKIFDSKVYCLMGDGCAMEGVSSEVSSLAAHLKLDNLILIYDANHISLDGPLAESCSEDTKKRYEAYGWEVVVVEDGNDLNQIQHAFDWARNNQHCPRLIIAHTIIGKGAPNKAGTHKVHGSPLGPEEVLATKIALGLPEEPFYVPQTVYDYFEQRLSLDQAKEEEWNRIFEEWGMENPELLEEFRAMLEKRLPADLERIGELPITSPIAGRKASQEILNTLAERLPQLYGGSADLSCSDLTMIKKYPIVEPGVFHGRNIKFGVREFGMAAMATGMAQTGLITPFIGTFLTFSDYMRNAIRLCSLMREHVIYQFTHDSVFLGEDGPTHQAVEHYAALRAIPNLHVIRPGDANEVKMAWIAALRYHGPTAIILSRQSLPEIPETQKPYEEGVGRGAYILKKETKIPDYTLVATGSELHLAVDVAQELEKLDKDVRVISMPCWEIFEQQSQEYKDSIFGGNLGRAVSIEAGVEQGWHKYIGKEGIAICMEGYGASAPYKDLAAEFGFTIESILERIL